MRESIWLLIFCALLNTSAVWASTNKRDKAQVRAFRNEQPCPATGLKRGACPGFEVDHVQSLCSGGADKKENLQWLSKEDHRFKTLVDVRECRKLERAARRPAG